MQIVQQQFTWMENPLQYVREMDMAATLTKMGNYTLMMPGYFLHWAPHLISGKAGMDELSVERQEKTTKDIFMYIKLIKCGHKTMTVHLTTMGRTPRVLHPKKF